MSGHVAVGGVMLWVLLVLGWAGLVFVSMEYVAVMWWTMPCSVKPTRLTSSSVTDRPIVTPLVFRKLMPWSLICSVLTIDPCNYNTDLSRK